MIIVIIEQSYVHTIDNSAPYGNSYGNSQYIGVYMEPVGSSISRQVWVRSFYKSDIKKYFNNLQENH